jgi:hypothetical protein
MVQEAVVGDAVAVCLRRKGRNCCGGANDARGGTGHEAAPPRRGATEAGPKLPLADQGHRAQRHTGRDGGAMITVGGFLEKKPRRPFMIP